MNKDTVAGAVKKAGGTVREKVDSAVGDKKGAALGTKDKLEGKTQETWGKVKDAVKK